MHGTERDCPGSDVKVYAVHFNVKGESAMIHEEGEDGIEGELGL